MRKLRIAAVILLVAAVSHAQELKHAIRLTAVGVEAQISCNGSAPDVSYNMYRVLTTTATTSATCPASGYTILGTSPMSSACGWTDTTIVQGDNYCYAATGLNSLNQESAQSTPLFVSVPGAPVPPTNLQIVQISANKVALQWKAPAGVNVYGYRVLRKSFSSSAFVDVAYHIQGLTYDDAPGKGGWDYAVQDVSLPNHVVSGNSNVVIANVP